MSVVGIHNQKIIGFIGAFDYACVEIKIFYEKLKEKYPYMSKRTDCLYKREVHPLFEKPLDRGISVMINSLVVDEKYEGLGLGFLLMDFVNYHPKVKKYPTILGKFAANLRR